MKKIRLICFCALLTFVFYSCRKDDNLSPAPIASTDANTYSGEKVRDYITLLCTVSKSTPGFFPPQVARAYGYTGIANYEAVVNGIPGAQSLAGQLNGLNAADLPKPEVGKNYNWAISSNAALAAIITKMFGSNLSATNKASIDSMEQAALTAFALNEAADVKDRSVTFGKAVADAVYNYSKTDGGDESYKDPFQLPFTLPTDSFCWVPTSATVHPVSPLWGNNRPFITADISNTQSPPHAAFSIAPTSAFYKEAMNVYNQVSNNTTEQIEIAKYWADDPFNTCTPAGHTFNIMSQLLQETRSTLEKSSVVFAKLAIAENDAFISCWKGKYKYVLIRPVSYIRKYIIPSFNSIIGTPPFPAYTSGHSCEAGAGSRIFTKMFTDGSGNYQFTDYGQLRYGFAARSFSNFNELAEECANSRFYAGIHYPMDNSKGLQVGYAIGDNVNNMLSWPSFVK